MNLTLESETLKLDFCEKTGRLLSLTAKQTGWQIQDRAEIGLNWRLMVPLSEELRNNGVHGEKQTLTALEQGKDGIVFVWDGVDSERGGRLDIKITLHVRAEGPQIVYTISVENRSPYTVENVYCPYLGDVQRPRDAAYLNAFFYNYNRGIEVGMWPNFWNQEGYFGVDFPTQLQGQMCAGAPMTPYYLIHDGKQGLYAGVKTASAELVSWMAELRPGYGSSIDSRVPVSREIAGKPVQTLFAALHVPYILPGESRALTPVALEA